MHLMPSQAEGFTRQEITFSGSVNIRQIGHAILHISRYNESYLVPLPNIKIKGILTGSPYPELQGTYYIPSTSGYMSSIDFSGKGLFSSTDKKHSFEAKLYRDGEEGNPSHTVSGNWDGQFTFHDCTKDVDVETFDLNTSKTTQLTTEPISEQDPWESRRAWHDVHEALTLGNMQGAADAKAKLESGQREMRATDDDGRGWERLFYEDGKTPDEVARTLTEKIGVTINAEETVGLWRFRRTEWEQLQFKKPYHGDMCPDNTHANVTAEEATAVSGVRGHEHANGIATEAVVTATSNQMPNTSTQQSLPVKTTSVHHQTTSVAADSAETPADHAHAQPPPPTTTAPNRSEPTRQVTSRPPKEDSTPRVFDNTNRDSPVELAQPRHVAQEPATQLQSGIEGMSLDEKAQVEEFLRDQYSSVGATAGRRVKQ
jgi:hypothetical protein